jgi:hypothetical protein
MANTNRRMNEADVREDIAMPLLSTLGYKAGTANDIVREKALAYPRAFLGRKKNSDPPLRGRADYILTVLGAGSWTLEIKAEDVPIDRDAIEQALTYARHPQIAGSYAAILNGRRFVAFHNTQRSDDAPLIDISFTDIETLTKALVSTFSPNAIRHDCSPPRVDLNAPLATGLRSTATITKASIHYNEFTWQCNQSIPQEAEKLLDETCRRMSGLWVNASKGWIRRDEQSRIIAKLEWNFPHEGLKEFAEKNQMAEMEYVCLSSMISEDPLKPSIFHIVGQITVQAGEGIFDTATWSTKIADLDMIMAYSGQAIGFLEAESFRGIVEAKYLLSYPRLPELQIIQLGTGTLEMTVQR